MGYFSPGNAINSNLGPLLGALPSSQDTVLTTQGIANWQAATFTVTKKVIAANPRGKVRRVKIIAPNADAKLAWKTASPNGSAPTVTCGLAGGANDGTIIPQGALEEFNLPDDVDLYVTPSAACVLQVTMWES
jgi:hypothetical protein